MKPAALGVRMHSGWGVLVAISGDAHSFDVLERRRIVTADASIRGAYQPYHRAAKLTLSKAGEYLARCAVLSERLARQALDDVVQALHDRDYRVGACAVLTGSGRPLPPLPKILASHPLRHTAEGVFFRKVVSAACHHLRIATTSFRERELDQSVDDALGKAGRPIRETIAGLGRSLGPPWTLDHKKATVAALLALATDAAHGKSSPVID
jgi:hypothetical protein